MTIPLIIQYTNLIHKHGNIKADEIKKFREEYKDDEVFIKRADTLDKIWKLKPEEK